MTVDIGVQAQQLAAELRSLNGHHSDGTEDTASQQTVAEPNGASREPASEPERKWPALDDAALYGLAGDIVRTIAPQTEADPTAILADSLGMFGCAVGRNPHALVGATRHGANEYILTVGETARSRKGTAQDEAERIMERAVDGWAVVARGGLSSGEGIIHAIRDATWKVGKDGLPTVDDEGVQDKRLLLIESEFSSVLKVASREGNTLTEVLRKGWDGKDLQTLTRNSPLKATAPHISLIGHITEHELRRCLDDVAQFNGFANRHLLMCVRRAQALPEGGWVPEEAIAKLASRLREAVSAAQTRIDPIRRDDDTKRAWAAVYPALTADRPGMLGAITARAEAHVLRLSLIYALLDQAPSIGLPHLKAALAVWQYSEASADYIFGDATGDPLADRVLSALRGSGSMTQTALSDLFGRHVRAVALSRALETLITAGKVRCRQEETGGRPRTVWEAV